MYYLRPITMAILLLAGGSALAQASPSIGAKLYIDQTSFDFGYIPAGEAVSHSYFFLNKGIDSLKILKVQPGCGCTKAPLKKDVVAAGDSAEVELIFTASRGSHGPVTKSAAVTSNDPDRSSFQLTFKGTTYEKPDSLLPLALSASTIRWDDKNRDKEMKVVVKNVSKNTVRLKLVSQPYGYLKIDLPDSEIKPGKDKEIKVRIQASVTDQEFKKSFTFQLNDAAGTRYTIPTGLAKQVIMPQIQAAPANKPAPGTPADTTSKASK